MSLIHGVQGQVLAITNEALALALLAGALGWAVGYCPNTRPRRGRARNPKKENAEKHAADFRMMQNLRSEFEDPKTSPLQRGLVLNMYCQAYERVNGILSKPKIVLRVRITSPCCFVGETKNGVQNAEHRHASAALQR